MSEMWVNLLYGVLAARLGRALLAALIAAGLVGIALLLHSYGEIRAGWAWDGAWGGLARALFSFFAGVGLFRLRQKRRAPGIPAVLLAVAVIVAMAPKSFGGGAYELICVVLLFPLLVWFGAEATMGRRSEALGNLAGYLSYPIYLLQASFLLVLGPLWVRLARIMPADGWIKLTTYAVVVTVGSWIVARWYDTPVRDTLRHRFARRAPRPAAETAP